MVAVPGKNKIERAFKILIDNAAGAAQDLTNDLVPGSVKGGGISLDDADMTGVGNTVKNYLAGHGSAPISAKFHMNDTTTTGATTVLNGIAGKVGTITLQWGDDGAAPTTGDLEWEGEYVCLGADVGVDGGKFVHDCKFSPSGATAPAWGTVT